VARGVKNLLKYSSYLLRTSKAIVKTHLAAGALTMSQILLLSRHTPHATHHGKT
jgi:hypothetical protein